MKERKERNIPNIPNEEFGMEFGDPNAMKLYEIPFMSQKDHKKNSSLQLAEGRSACKEEK